MCFVPYRHVHSIILLSVTSVLITGASRYDYQFHRMLAVATSQTMEEFQRLGRTNTIALENMKQKLLESPLWERRMVELLSNTGR